jgi:hypothetical protein
MVGSLWRIQVSPSNEPFSLCLLAAPTAKICSNRSPAFVPRRQRIGGNWIWRRRFLRSQLCPIASYVPVSRIEIGCCTVRRQNPRRGCSRSQCQGGYIACTTRSRSVDSPFLQSNHSRSPSGRRATVRRGLLLGCAGTCQRSAFLSLYLGQALKGSMLLYDYLPG